MKNDLFERFQNLKSIKSPQKRGRIFDREFLRDFFNLQGIEYTPPFRTPTEENDGALFYESNHILLQAKWENESIGAPHIREFKFKLIKRKMLGVFISISGFTSTAEKEAVEVNKDLILLDGEEFERILAERLQIQGILHDKFKYLRLELNPHYQVSQIIEQKQEGISAYLACYLKTLKDRYSKELVGYIERRILAKIHYEEFSGIISFLSEKTTTLFEILKKGKNNIVLLADAGLGKSCEFKNIAIKFSDEESGVIPIFIELNRYANEDLEEYIQIKSNVDISKFDSSELVFLLDGFDEVSDKNIAARKIKTFTDKFPAYKLVISCRTNIYTTQLQDFSVFYLLPLEYEQIKNYSELILKQKATLFLSKLSQSRLFDIAKNPFYLTKIIEIYAREKGIPDNKGKIFETIVNESLISEKGKFVDKIDFEQDYPLQVIRKHLELLALIMETLQTNAISVIDFSKVFVDSKLREVISQVGLLKTISFKEQLFYQFQHNNFQEYLAAKKLSAYDFKTVLDFISYPNITKMNPSWVNTVAFLIELYPTSDLSNFIIENDPEVALKFEPDRLDEQTREAIFKAVFEKYTKRKIWIDRDIDYDEMARFGQSQRIVDYLMEYAKSKEHFTFRYNAIEMLGRMKAFKSPKLRALLIKYADDEKENTGVRHISLHALAWLYAEDHSVIKKLLHLRSSHDDWILSGLYYVIKESPFLDDYVDTLLDGIKHIRVDLQSRKVPLGDLRWNIRAGLERVKSYSGIGMIIEHFIRNPEDSEAVSLRDTLGKVIDNLIPLYNSNKQSFNLVIKLLESLSRKYLNQNEKHILRYFDKTGTRYQAFKNLYKKYKISDRGELLALVCDEKGLYFMIKEYQKGALSDNDMQIFLNGIAWKNRENYTKYLKTVNKRTGKFIPPPTRDYEKEGREKLERRIDLIFDQKLFLQEIQKVFKNGGKNTLTYKQLEELHAKNWREEKYDEFVLLELLKIFTENKQKVWGFQEIKNSIHKSNYDFFTISHIHDILEENPNIELKNKYVQRIEKYCKRNLAKVDFRQALEFNSCNLLSMFLWFFMRRFDFKYPRRVLLDMISFDWIEGHQYIGIEYLEPLLPFEKMKQRVLENLLTGIEVRPVLENHIRFCKKHKVYDCIEDLKKIILDPSAHFDIKKLALETLAEFPSSVEFLENLLESKDEGLLIECAGILLAKSNRKSIAKLEENIKSAPVSLALASARLLIPSQNIIAIEYYLTHFKNEKRSTLVREDRDLFYEIRTLEALPKLLDLLEYTYEIEIPEDAFDRLDNAIIRVLKSCAAQDEKSYVKVKEGLRQFIERNKAKHKNVNFLEATCDEIDKTYLINYKKDLTIEEAILKVKK